ncbi:hypothetical protein MASR2M15_08970 [Anaerolineales bacterium]
MQSSKFDSKNIINHFRNDPDAVSYQAGEFLYKSGEHDDKIYGIAEGTIEIIFQGQVFERVNAGGICGERTFIDDYPHTTSARALTDCKIVHVHEEKFLFLVHETPTFALQVMRQIVQRSRKLTRLLRDEN